MTSTGETPEASNFKPFTKSERIQQLNSIDKSITQLLQSAALALQALSSSRESPAPPATEQKEAFAQASDTYFRTLQFVDIGLRRQILGLEEADIVPEKDPSKPIDNSKLPGGQKPATSSEQVSEGTSGKLDIGFLNSQSDAVARNLEAELWQKARIFLENLEGSKVNDLGNDASGDHDMGN